MKKLFFMMSILLGFSAQACLSDVSLLADGKIKYAGVSYYGTSAANQEEVVNISTDVSTGKRYFQLERSPEKFEITECALPVQKGFPVTYYVNSQVHDFKADTLKIFKAVIHVMAKGPVALPEATSLYSTHTYYHYSKEGMGPRNVSKLAYFRPGYHIGNPPKYDGNGHLIVNWYGTQPSKVP